jgi:hypothetical protein
MSNQPGTEGAPEEQKSKKPAGNFHPTILPL